MPRLVSIRANYGHLQTRDARRPAAQRGQGGAVRRADLGNASSSRGELTFQPASHHPMDLFRHSNTYFNFLTLPPPPASLLHLPVFSRARGLRDCAGFDRKASGRLLRMLGRARAARWVAGRRGRPFAAVATSRLSARSRVLSGLAARALGRTCAGAQISIGVRALRTPERVWVACCGAGRRGRLLGAIAKWRIP